MIPAKKVCILLAALLLMAITRPASALIGSLDLTATYNAQEDCVHFTWNQVSDDQGRYTGIYDS